MQTDVGLPLSAGQEMSVKPYSPEGGSKKDQVRQMFDHIAPKYDFLNRTLSFGIDKIWRKRVVKLLRRKGAMQIMDVATGTGDLAIAIARSVRNAEIWGVDLSSGMLELAAKKVEKKGLQDRVKLRQGDSEALPFDDNSFDAITVAFGVRNFGDLNRGLSEMQRVLRSGGTLYVLEFSRPSTFPIRQLYGFYFTRILPWWGGLVSRDKAAYTYLPASVLEFPDGKDFEAELEKAGLKPIRSWKQTFGIATIYISEK